MLLPSVLSKTGPNKPPGGLVRRAEMQKAGRNCPFVHNYAGCYQWTRIEVYVSSGGSGTSILDKIVLPCFIN